MQQDTEVIQFECVIKVEPEQFENTEFLQQTSEQNINSVKNEYIAETEAVYIKVEEADALNDVPIVKLEPHG